MSNYGQQPPYGSSPYGQSNPHGQQGPYGRPAQPGYAQPPSPYGPPPNPYAPQPGYGQQYPPQQGQWAGQRPVRSVVHRAIPVVTLEALPGRGIESIVGDVVGVVARSRDLPPELRTGNPQEGYALLLTTSRQEAVARMVEMAQAAGADAVLGLRFDCSEITQSMSEVSAYGTAVKLVPTSDSEAGDQPTDPSQRADRDELEREE